MLKIKDISGDQEDSLVFADYRYNLPLIVKGRRGWILKISDESRLFNACNTVP